MLCCNNFWSPWPVWHIFHLLVLNPHLVTHLLITKHSPVQPKKYVSPPEAQHPVFLAAQGPRREVDIGTPCVHVQSWEQGNKGPMNRSWFEESGFQQKMSKLYWSMNVWFIFKDVTSIFVDWNHVKIIENRYVERITLSPSLSNHDGSFASLSRFPSEPMIVGGYLLKQKMVWVICHVYWCKIDGAGDYLNVYRKWWCKKP